MDGTKPNEQKGAQLAPRGRAVSRAAAQQSPRCAVGAAELPPAPAAPGLRGKATAECPLGLGRAALAGMKNCFTPQDHLHFLLSF